MDKILFIINPIAGGGRAVALISLIEDRMGIEGREFKIVISEKPEQAIRLSQENIDEYNTVVAVGGDGTVNEVAKGIINKGHGVLGIIPGGTGNDMAKSLGIPMDPVQAIELIIKGHKKMIDIGKVNSYNFLNITSVGFDAEVVLNNFKIRKKIKSHLSYAISVIYTLFEFKNKKVIIDIDGKKISESIVLLAVGSGKYYGGGMKVLPQAELDDGYLNICLISNISKFKLLSLFPTIFNGNHIKHTKYVSTYKAKSVKIIGESELPLNIDGDVICAKEVNISLEEKKLNVIFRKS